MKYLIEQATEARSKFVRELDTLDTLSSKAAGKARQGIDYEKEEFEWSQSLKMKMKEVFGIEDFRLCQRGCAS